MFDEALPPDHPLMQDAAFVQALRMCGQRPVTLPGGLTVLVQRIAKLRVAMLPRAAPPADLRQQLRQVSLHRLPLILSPDTACPHPFRLRLRRPRRLAWLDITGTPALRRTRLHGKWRNQLRKSERAGLAVTCKRLDADPDARLLRLEHKQAKENGYLNWPAPLTAAFAAVAPDQTFLFTARHQGQTIAQMLFLKHGTTATYHIGHTTRQGRALAAHNLLLWHAMQRLAQTGCRRLDLGLLDPRTPDLNRFKLRTGATEHLTGGTYLSWRPFALS